MTGTLLGRAGLAVAAGLLAAASLSAPAAATGTGTGTGTVQGVFTTAAGAPIADAIISVWTGDGTEVWNHVWTGADGRYEAVLPAGGYLLSFDSGNGGQWSPGQRDKAFAQVYTVVDGEILTVDEQEL